MTDSTPTTAACWLCGGVGQVAKDSTASDWFDRPLFGALRPNHHGGRPCPACEKQKPMPAEFRPEFTDDDRLSEKANDPSVGLMERTRLNGKVEGASGWRSRT